MITLQQVRCFLTLCDEQNFSRAASRCGVRQPSLTSAIKQLERELGGPLFVRGRRKSCLSGLGVAVQPHLAAMDRAATAAQYEAAAFLAAAGPLLSVKPDYFARFKPRRAAMRNAILSAAIAGTAFLVAGMAIHALQFGTASSSSELDHGVDIYKLESTINLKALPRQILNYVN